MSLGISGGPLREARAESSPGGRGD